MTLFFAFLVLLAILSTKLSNRFGIPLLIGFILIGVIAGSDVLNLFYFDNALLTRKIADIILIFIIFEGGFRVTREDFKTVGGPALSLATIGVALTAVILALAIHFVLKLDLLYSFIIASIISSTDAAAVFMITKANPIKNKLATTLNVESAANDPMAILLTVTFIQIATQSFSSPLMAVLSLFRQFISGIIIGWICFKISFFIFNKLESNNRGDYSVLLIGCILFTYGMADLLSANGIIAVFFMGYWLGNTNFPAKKSTSSFLESTSTILNMFLFIMLGLLSFPHRFVTIWKDALIIVFIMMCVARPLAVFLTLIPFKYTFKEKLFIICGGIKGAVPIVLATYPLAAGLDTNGFIFDTIFFTVFLSCVIQGTTLGPLAKLFHFSEKKKPETPYTVELHALSQSDVDMFELRIEDTSPNISKPIMDLHLGKDVVISAIVREGKIIPPKGNTLLLTDDILYILTSTNKIAEINSKINESEQEKLEK